MPSRLGRHPAAERVFARRAQPQLFVISRAVVASSAGSARQLARAVAVIRAHERAVDAATLRLPSRVLRGFRVLSWVEGRVVGELVYVDPSGRWGRSLARELADEARSHVRRAGIGTTVWDSLMARAAREQGDVDVRTALQAFSLSVGRLPGVRLPRGQLGLVDATAAYDWVMQDYKLLSARQQARVQRVLSILNRGTDQTHAAGLPRAVSTPAGNCPDGVTVQCVDDLMTANRAQAYYRTMLGLSGPLPPVTMVYCGVVCERLLGFIKPAVVGAEAATTANCKIVLLPVGNGYTGADRRYVIAHEAFHCIQQDIVSGPLPPWLSEGTPTWAGCQFEPRARRAVGAPYLHYANYAVTPDLPAGEIMPQLFLRSYSAIGFFALMQNVGLDPWSRMRAMLTAGVGGNNRAAYDAATMGDERTLLEDWAASYFRDARGPEWQLRGPCAPLPDARVPPKPLLISNDSSFTKNARPYTVGTYTLDSQADLIHVTSTSGGNVRLDGGGVQDRHVTASYYCTAADGCRCPPGEQYEGPAFTRLTDSPQVLIGLTGGTDGVTATFEGQRLTCGKPAPVVYIRVQLTESYSHTLSDGSQTWTSTATTDTLHKTTPANLQQDSQIPSALLLSSAMTASTVDNGSPPTTCKWSGSLTTGAEPHISLAQRAGRVYALISWPDLLGPAWNQTLTQADSPNCPSYASFNPTQGSVVTSMPTGDGFSSMDHFYNAVFPINPSGTGQAPPLKLTMQSTGDIPGEVDQTQASGTVTISYGKCPVGANACNRIP
ncbi:MAG: hypothetical protein ACXVS6_08790 [Solirubrobacteraceae bacterium]